MEQSDLSRSELKRAAARYAVEHFVKSGMLVGLGSGSTAEIFVEELAREVGQGTLMGITAVATSDKVELMARTFGITIASLNDVNGLDVTVDGADEIEPRSFGLLKGRGGALLREKLVASVSKLEVIIADESKLVNILGEKTPIPVEVIPFGWHHTASRLRNIGCEPSLRLRDPLKGIPYLTDSHNYVFDCRFNPITDPVALAAAIKNLVGVVEHGIFMGVAGHIIIAGPGGVYEINH